MPYLTTYTDNGRGVQKMGHGLVTGAEIFSSAVQESSDEERTRRLQYGLIDFSNVREFLVTPSDIRRIVEVNRKTAALTPEACIALVAPAELPYAMSRLWHTLSDDLAWTSYVFHTRSDALAWLRKELRYRHGEVEARDLFPSLEWATKSPNESA